MEPADRRHKYIFALLGVLVLLGLYLTSRYNYLLFHSLAELFSIAVACGIFMLAWNSRRFVENNYLLFVGIAYLFVGCLDTLHTLAYKGMGVFAEYGTNLPTQLWIAGRYIESFSLLFAPLFIGRKVRPWLVFFGYAVVTGILLGTIFYWGIFPDCFIEGSGLTAFKKISEYIISLILLASIFSLLRRRRDFDTSVLKLLIASIVITIFSEFAFTFYIHAYDLSNLIGHFLKIVSFYLIYSALIRTGLVKPHDLLFRNLKRSEQEVQRRNEFLNNVLEALSSPFYVIDANDYSIKMSNYAARLGEISGHATCYALTHKSDRPCGSAEHPCPVEEIKRTKGPVTVEHIHHDMDGSPRNVEVHGYPVLDDEGNVIQVIEYCLDITKRKQAEDRLRETLEESQQRQAEVSALLESLEDSEQRFRSVMETASDAIIVSDSRGKITFWNRAAETIFGYSAGEAIGGSITTIMPERFLDEYQEGIDQLIWTKKSAIIGKTIEGVGLKKDDSELPIELSFAAWKVKDETFFTVIARDITQRKIEETRKAEDQELERQRVLSMRSDRLRSLGEMAAGIAHELNQPLQGVRGLAEHLLISVDRGWNLTEEKIRDRAKLIIEQADRMVHIIEHVRIFARESGKPELRPVQVNEVVRTGMDMLGTQFRARGIQLECELGGRLPVILANPFSLEEVIINLLINARDALEEQMKIGSLSEPPQVLLRTLLDQSNSEKHVGIKVIDNGIGIPKDMIDRVFDPFFTTKGPDRGTGLGLSISRSIVEDFGGIINIESASGSGTVVTIFLPVVEPDAQEV